VPPAAEDAALGVMAMEATWEPLSPLPWVGLGVGLDGVELLAGFAVDMEPAHPLVPNKKPRTKEVTVKRVLLTFLVNARIM
jgi:hypothetical protein